MSLVIGSLSGLAGRGTLAFFTSQKVSDANAFSGGTVDIAGLLTGTGSTNSVLTTNVFKWNTAGAGGTTANCTHINTPPSSDIRTQRMAPGHYCVAPIDLYNTNTNALDAWIRMRLVRSTAVNAQATAEEDLAAEALNDRLKFYMHEYTGGTTAGVTPAGWTAVQAANKEARDADCTTTSYKPTWVQAAATGADSYLGVDYDFNYVPGSSSGQIVGGAVAGGTGASRVAVSTLADIGKNVGAHPGVSALQVTGSTQPYAAAQDAIALDLVNATDEAPANAAASKNGLRLRNGTTAAPEVTPGTAVTASDAAPTEGNMKTALTTRNSYNIVGNDEVTNPVKAGPLFNGAEASGSNAEAELLAGGRRFFCAAVFFPLDTDNSLSTMYADATVLGATAGTNRLLPAFASYGVLTAGQYADCRELTLSVNCESLGTVAQAVSGQNGKGDNASMGGNVTYYLVLSAAQKAGRTTP